MNHAQRYPRVYVAAPIFTPEQLADVGAVVSVLESCGYTTYSPSRDGIMLAPDDPAERRDEVYYSNLRAVKQSDLLVALLDVKDTGTIWELGAAAGRDIPIIAVTLNVPQMNVMLERGVLAHVRSLDDLSVAASALQFALCYGVKINAEFRSVRSQVVQSMKTSYTYSGQTQ